MAILLLFAFIAGFVTILAPCIWPLLPIILSATASSKGHRRPLGVTIGIMLSFALLTLFIATFVRIFHFDPNVLRIAAVIVIGFLGLSLIIPYVGVMTEAFISRFTSRMGGTPRKKSGFWSGFLAGCTLGIVWAPCAGPIFASIAALASVGVVSFNLIVITAAYVTGVGIPLFLFAYGGQTLFRKTRFLSSYTLTIQKVFGVMMILMAVLIATNYDTILQVKLLNLFPSYTQALTNIENNQEVQKQLALLKGQQAQPLLSTNDLLNTNTPSPEIAGVSHWLNTNKPLTLSALRGNVVLIDFWTYTCINCIRTLPYVTRWYDTYKNSGFVVVGVHTPEFTFEKDTKNVKMAIQQYGIHYPVAQDNDYATWNAFSNQYWPAEYLIDANGIVRRTHFGEGEYPEMERAIRLLLEEKGTNVATVSSSLVDQPPQGPLTPETYLGLNRSERFASNELMTKTGLQSFTLPVVLPLHAVAFNGMWDIENEYVTPKTGASLQVHFYAQKVFLVLMPAEGIGKLMVRFDGKNVTPQQAGSDVSDGIVTVLAPRLYNLIALPDKEEHTLELDVESDGIEMFAFTFG